MDLGYVYFLHTEDPNTWEFTISAGSNPILLASYVAETASADDCIDPYYAHLHQHARGSFAENSSQYGDAPATRESVPITNAAEYQDYVSFQY
jgi:hypothetical protein